MTASPNPKRWTERYLNALPEKPRGECSAMAAAIRAAANWQSRKKAPIRMARAAFHQSESLRQRHLSLFPDRAAPACERGCSYCCYGFKVDVSVPEALAIVDHQREHLDANAFATFREKVQVEADRVKHFNLEERAVDLAPCVLLDVEHSECSVYEVRPLACRHHHSLEVEPCEQHHRDPAGDHYAVVDEVAHRDGQLSQFAVQHALAGLGLDESAYELTNALALAMRDESVAARWQKGLGVFEAARLASDEGDQRWVDEHQMVQRSNPPSKM